MKGLIAIIVALLLSSCGGGSTGTGLSNGLIISDIGQSQQGVKITVLETGNSTISNSAGEFYLPEIDAAAEFTLLLERDDREIQIVIGGASNSNFNNQDRQARLIFVFP
jgi:hypothetical protein